MAYEVTWKDQNNLNEVEYIKLEKDGLDVIDTIIEKYGQEGYDSITPEDMNRFKWAGVYEQKPRNGYFMMRVRINSGILKANQAKVLGGIARDYGRGIANITTRGAIQFHWVKVEHLPDIFNRLKECGMSSFEACGDCPRTIVGNPLAGIDPEELFDTGALVEQVNEMFLLNKDFSNLPRKFKISISSSTKNPGNAQINDIGFTPATKEVSGENLQGFHIWVGGGLSATPHLAQRLNLFVTPEQVPMVTQKVCEIFRDHGYREKRNHSRLKFLVADWGVDRFQEELLKLTGPLPDRGTDLLEEWNASYYYGIHPQKQPELFYLGLHVPLGEITADELETLGVLAEDYGMGQLRTTLTQNIILPGLKKEDLEQILDHPVFLRLTPAPNAFAGYTVACTGKEYCNLALVETKGVARSVMEYLDARYHLEEPIRIHITGCPNGCGQKHIADIGLQGAFAKGEQGPVEAFTLWMGGSLNGEGIYTNHLKQTIPAPQVPETLGRILEYYLSHKSQYKNFHAFAREADLNSLI